MDPDFRIPTTYIRRGTTTPRSVPEVQWPPTWRRQGPDLPGDLLQWLLNRVTRFKNGSPCLQTTMPFLFEKIGLELSDKINALNVSLKRFTVIKLIIYFSLQICLSKSLKICQPITAQTCKLK
jgi:hypothetical protein